MGQVALTEEGGLKATTSVLHKLKLVIGQELSGTDQTGLTTMTQKVQNIANKLPFEIQNAITAFDKDTRQAIIITLLNEGDLRFSELKEKLSDPDQAIHNQTLTNALEKLQKGGLINKRVADTEGGDIKSYYEVSEYGERFVDCLLNSLGSVDDFEPQEPRYQNVENMHQSNGEPVAIETPVNIDSQQSDPDKNPPNPGL